MDGKLDAPVTRSSRLRISHLEQGYHFREKAEVAGFLKKHPFLVPLLHEARASIEQHFPQSQLFLDVVADREEADERQLVLFIASNLNPDEALDRLEQFDEAWWLDALEQAQGALSINLEFR